MTIEINKDLKFWWTRHGIERWTQRSTFDGLPSRLLSCCEPASKDLRYHLAKTYPAHEQDMKRRTNVPYVYWVEKNRENRIWRVFVTAPVDPGMYEIVTYFEVDYTQFHADAQKVDEAA